MREEAHLTAGQALPSSAPATTWALRLPNPGQGIPVRVAQGSHSSQTPTQPCPGPPGREGRNYQSENGRKGQEDRVYPLLEGKTRTLSICYLSHSVPVSPGGEASPTKTEGQADGQTDRQGQQRTPLGSRAFFALWA